MNALVFCFVAQADPDLVDAVKKLSAATERIADALTDKIEEKEKPPLSPFSGTAGVSLVYLAGNSNALTASALVNMQLLLGPWSIGLAGNAAYGQARTGTDTSDKVTALQAFGELRGGRSLSEILGAYALVGTGLDHVAKIEWRAYGEAGATVTFVKRKEKDFLRLLLTADLGLRYQQESWYVYYLDQDFTNTGRPDPAGKHALPFKLGVNFRYGIREGLVFTDALELLPDVLNARNFNLNNSTSLSVKVVGPFALTTSFLLRYNGNPAPGAKVLDTQLALSATVSF